MPGYYRTDKYKDRPRSASGLKGVLYFPRCTRKPWRAYGRFKGQFVNIGYFETKEVAARKYNLWVMKRYGAEAYLNPITASESRHQEQPRRNCPAHASRHPLHAGSRLAQE